MASFFFLPTGLSFKSFIFNHWYMQYNLQLCTCIKQTTQHLLGVVSTLCNHVLLMKVNFHYEHMHYEDFDKSAECCTGC